MLRAAISGASAGGSAGLFVAGGLVLPAVIAVLGAVVAVALVASMAALRQARRTAVLVAPVIDAYNANVARFLAEVDDLTRPPGPDG